MKITKVCENCKNKYDTYRLKAKHCSQECYLENRWGVSKCKFCSKEIDKFRYCNDKCRNSFWLKNEYRLLKKKRMWERKIDILKTLGNKCVHCGINDIRVLDLDHIDPSTKIKVPKRAYTMSNRLLAWGKEMGNLRILCANCHRIHTWKQMKYANY